MNIVTESQLTLERSEALLRKNSADLSAFLQEVGVGYKIDGTEVTTTCHFIKLNGNLQVRFADFASFLVNKIIDFAIPRSEIDEAQNYHQAHNSTPKFYPSKKKQRHSLHGQNRKLDLLDKRHYSSIRPEASFYSL